jgi:hypothetical protein
MHINLNTTPCAAQASNGGSHAPVIRLLAVGQVAGVVTGAALAAVALEVWVGEVGADLLGGGPEVIQRVGLVGQDVACGNQDRVGVHALTAIREPEGVVQGEGGVRVCPAVEVPVGLGGVSMCLQRFNCVVYGQLGLN